MDFDLNNDQKEIKAVARELLSARSPFAKVREAAEAGRPDAALWRGVVELGWPGIDAEPGGAVVIVVDGDEASVVPDPSLEPFDAIDSTRRFSRLAAGDGEPLETGAAERMYAALAAEVVGVCQRALDMTLAYVKER